MEKFLRLGESAVEAEMVDVRVMRVRAKSFMVVRWWDGSLKEIWCC
jgi:hypothetical protein